MTRCGVAVVDALPSRRVAVVQAEVITTEPGAPLGARLRQLELRLEELVEAYRPDRVAIEQVFSQHNVRTVLGTAQSAGVAALVASRHDLPAAYHTPSEVKAAVTGSGRADKRQVARMVARIASCELRGPADLTDAVALGICSAWRGGLPTALAGAR